jgi:hypothetical protein
MNPKHAFRIVVAGEDFGAVLYAQELSGRLAAELEPALEISSDAWKFEALSNPQAGKQAAHGACKADMVIIAADGAVEPPAHVKSWIESWMPRKRKRSSALVALIDHEDHTPYARSPLCAYLRRIARKGGMDFLTNSANCRQHDFEVTTQVPQRQRQIA